MIWFSGRILTTIIVIGKITPEQAQSAIGKYFGAWKANGPKPETDLPIAPPNQPTTISVPDASRVQNSVVLAQNWRSSVPIRTITRSTSATPFWVGDSIRHGSASIEKGFRSGLFRQLRNPSRPDTWGLYKPVRQRPEERYAKQPTSRRERLFGCRPNRSVGMNSSRSRTSSSRNIIERSQHRADSAWLCRPHIWIYRLMNPRLPHSCMSICTGRRPIGLSQMDAAGDLVRVSQ